MPRDERNKQGEASGERRYEIFISSTFEDLRDERRQIQEYIIRQGNVPVGMELFNAGHVDQWRVIQKVIDDCDYYLLVVARRYGSVTADGISYTEKEYLYARKKRKPIMVFLQSETTSGSRPAWKDEDASKRRKLAAFRKSLKVEGLIAPWENSAQLMDEVRARLPKWIEANPQAGWVRSGDWEREKHVYHYVLNLLKPSGRRLDLPKESAELYALSTKLDRIESLFAAMNALMSFYAERQLPPQVRVYFAYRLTAPVRIKYRSKSEALYRIAISTTRDRPWQRGLYVTQNSNIHRVYESVEQQYVADAADPRVVNQKVPKEGSVFGTPVTYQGQPVGVVGVSSARRRDAVKHAPLVNLLDSLFEALFLAYGQHLLDSSPQEVVTTMRRVIADHFAAEL